MQSYWFGDIEDGRCSPFTGDVNAVVSRILALSSQMDTFTPPDWQQAVVLWVLL